MYAATAKVERVVVRRMSRWRVMLRAREAAEALGRERRAGTVMRGVDIRVPWIKSVRRRWIQGGKCTVKRPREIVPMIFKVGTVRITAARLPTLRLNSPDDRFGACVRSLYGFKNSGVGHFSIYFWVPLPIGRACGIRALCLESPPHCGQVRCCEM